jgi:hypothetical protein
MKISWSNWDLFSAGACDSIAWSKKLRRLIYFFGIDRYWALKMEMAPGSEPPHIKKILDALRPFCYGLSLCGAGAGGFGALVLGRGIDEDCLRSVVNDLNEELTDKLSLHHITVDDVGLAAEEILNSSISTNVGLKEILLAY